MQIGNLIQIGFGEAGGDIIRRGLQVCVRLHVSAMVHCRRARHCSGSHNTASSDSCLTVQDKGGGAVVECLPGVRVDAVFVFCDIRQFTDVTECLQGGVMVFVNHVARIVHGVRDCHSALRHWLLSLHWLLSSYCSSVAFLKLTPLLCDPGPSCTQAAACFGGAANKNIGDAFLLVWKLPVLQPQQLTQLQQQQEQQTGPGGQGLLGPPGFAAAAAIGGRDRTGSDLDADEDLAEAGLKESDGAFDSRVHKLRKMGSRRGKSRQVAQLAAAWDTEVVLRVPLATHHSTVKATMFFTMSRSRAVQNAVQEASARRLQLQYARVRPTAAAARSAAAAAGAAAAATVSATAAAAAATIAASAAAAAAAPAAGASIGPAGGASAAAAAPGPGARPGVVLSSSLAAGAGMSGVTTSAAAAAAAVGVVSAATPGARRRSDIAAAYSPEAVSRVADNALAAVLRAIVDTHLSNERGALSAYATEPSIRARFTEGYRVKMGWGLHIGWAIEGAIGSHYKIDASYLSPHVNMAARLEVRRSRALVPPAQFPGGD